MTFICRIFAQSDDEINEIGDGTLRENYWSQNAN